MAIPMPGDPDTPEALNASLLEQIVELRRELQQAQAENAQAVAWLREKSTIHHRLAVEAKKDGDREIASSHLSLSSAYSTAASAFERGEHDQGQPPLNSPPRGE